MKKYIKPELETITLFEDIICSSKDDGTGLPYAPVNPNSVPDPWTTLD
jgi:hypothetical protein